MRAGFTARVAVLASVAWGVLAFGAVYPWAYVPLFAGCLVAAISGFLSHRREPMQLVLWICSALVLAALGCQLVPLPPSMIRAVSPEAAAVLPQMDLDLSLHPGASHALSLDPPATQTALAIAAVLFLLVSGTARLASRTGPRSLAQGIGVIGVVVALIGIIQKPLFTGRIYGFWTPASLGSPFGPFVNRNHFAGWMAMALPLVLGLLCAGIARGMRGVRPTWRDRAIWLSSREASQLVLYGAAAVVMAVATVMSFSRSGIGAVLVGVVITGAFVARVQAQTSRRLTAAVCLMGVLVAAGAWVGVDAIGARFSDLGAGEFSKRPGAWADALGIARRFPVTGTGVNTYGDATVFYQRHNLDQHYEQAHNDYLQLLAEGGLLVSVPALALLAAFTWEVRRRFSRTEPDSTAWWLRAAAVSGLLAIAFQEVIEFSLQMPGNAVLCAVLCGIAIHHPRATRKLDRRHDWSAA